MNGSTTTNAAAGMVLFDLFTIVSRTSLTWVDPSRTGTPPNVVPLKPSMMNE